MKILLFKVQTITYLHIENMKDSFLEMNSFVAQISSKILFKQRDTIWL